MALQATTRTFPGHVRNNVIVAPLCYFRPLAHGCKKPTKGRATEDDFAEKQRFGRLIDEPLFNQSINQSERQIEDYFAHKSSGNACFYRRVGRPSRSPRGGCLHAERDEQSTLCTLTDARLWCDSWPSKYRRQWHRASAHRLLPWIYASCTHAQIPA